ncbi:hypothetical protein CTRI78_v007204 [Colletotrichum trifolii]|uniref:Uncharacterized protein n=1 Tax=Colletotrichum trifolii TaxID=5466 RepID=A0A4R8RCS9_COLTR|nr:hypothetical protein CTRI78_v007204 [Colletotrichum trifolii]
MQFPYTLTLAALLAAAAEAASTCLGGAPVPPLETRKFYPFSRLPNGIDVATFDGGFVSYAAPSINSKNGVVEITNNSRWKKIVCPVDEDLSECYWINAHDTCKSTTVIGTEIILVGFIAPLAAPGGR